MNFKSNNLKTLLMTRAKRIKYVSNRKIDLHVTHCKIIWKFMASFTSVILKPAVKAHIRLTNILNRRQIS